MVIVLDVYLAIELVFDTHCNMTNLVGLISVYEFCQGCKIIYKKLHVYILGWNSLPLCVYFMIIIMNEEKQFSMFAQKDEGGEGRESNSMFTIRNSWAFYNWNPPVSVLLGGGVNNKIPPILSLCPFHVSKSLGTIHKSRNQWF